MWNNLLVCGRRKKMKSEQVWFQNQINVTRIFLWCLDTRASVLQGPTFAVDIGCLQVHATRLPRHKINRLWQCHVTLFQFQLKTNFHFPPFLKSASGVFFPKFLPLRWQRAAPEAMGFLNRYEDEHHSSVINTRQYRGPEVGCLAGLCPETTRVQSRVCC